MAACMCIKEVSSGPSFLYLYSHHETINLSLHTIYRLQMRVTVHPQFVTRLIPLFYCYLLCTFSSAFPIAIHKLHLKCKFLPLKHVHLLIMLFYTCCNCFQFFSHLLRLLLFFQSQHHSQWPMHANAFTNNGQSIIEFENLAIGLKDLKWLYIFYSKLSTIK